MKVIIVDNGTSFLESLTKLFLHDEYSVIHIDDISVESITPGTLVVLSGGHAFPVVWHDKYYAKELELIRSYSGPILGICLGFELIAHAYGSHLSMLPRKTHVKRIITINEEGRRYISQPHIVAFESHHYALRTVHHPLISLGATKNTIEIIRHDTKPIFAVQFHPEKFNDAQGITLFKELLRALIIS